MSFGYELWESSYYRRDLSIDTSLCIINSIICIIGVDNISNNRKSVRHPTPTINNNPLNRRVFFVDWCCCCCCCCLFYLRARRMSMQGREDIFANAESPIEFENEFFKGRMLFLLRCSPPNPKVGPCCNGAIVVCIYDTQISGPTVCNLRPSKHPRHHHEACTDILGVRVAPFC